MTLGCEIDHIVNVVLCKELVNQLPVTDVTFDKEAAFIVDVVLDGTEITSVSQGIKNDDLDVVVHILFVEQILDKVRADKSGSPSNEISLHKFCTIYLSIKNDDTLLYI